MKLLIIFISIISFTSAQVKLLFPQEEVINISNIKFFNDSFGIAWGSTGQVKITEDGGESFRDISIFTVSDIKSVYFFNNKVGWVCGNQNGLYKTIDGGQNWDNKNFGDDFDYLDIRFFSDSLGYLLREGALYITKDGGESFDVLYDKYSKGNYIPFDHVDYYNDSTIVLFNRDEIMFSNNFGLSWVFQHNISSSDGITYATVSKNKFYMFITSGLSVSSDTGKTFENYRYYDRSWSDLKVYNDTVYLLYSNMIYIQPNKNELRTIFLVHSKGAFELFVKDNNTFFLDTYNGMFKYSDYGRNFKQLFYEDQNPGETYFFNNKGYFYSGYSNVYTSDYPFNNFQLIDSVWNYETDPHIRINENTLLKSSGKWESYKYSTYYYLSENNGITWRLLYGGADNLSILDNDIVIAADSGLYISYDKGYTWNKQNSNISSIYPSYTFPYKNYILLRDNRSTYLSQDYGLYFEFLDSNLVLNSYFENNDYFYCILTRDWEPAIHLLKSTYNLEKTKIKLPFKKVNSFIFIDSLLGYFAPDAGLYETTDGGNSFNLIFNKRVAEVFNLNNQLYARTTFGEFYFIKDLPSLKDQSLSVLNNDQPTLYSLYQNYPNPFNSVTTIKYQLPLEGKTKISIYDLLGSLVDNIELGIKQAGIYEYQYNANKLSSGIYFYRINSEGFQATKKFVLLK